MNDHDEILIEKKCKLFVLTKNGEEQIKKKGLPLFVDLILQDPEFISSYKLGEIDFIESPDGLSPDDIMEIKGILDDEIVKEQANFFSEEYQLA